MGRKPAPQPLPLSEATAPAEPDQPSGGSLRLTSPADSTRSPRSPRSPFRLTQKRAQSAGGKQPLHVADLVQQQPEEDYPPISATLQEPFDQPTYHPSGQQPPLHQHQHQQQHQSQPQHQHQHDDRGQGRGTPSGHRNHNQRHNDEKASKSGFFFSFGKSSKSAERLQPQPHSDSRNEIMSRGTDRPGVNRQNSKQSAEYSVPEQPLQKPMPTYPSKSEVSLASSAEFEPSSNASNRKDKSKGFRFGRTGSIRDADTAGSLDTAPAKLIEPPERAQTVAALKTAPVAQHDRSFREMMSSSARNHSADRAHARDTPGRDGHRDRDHVRGQPSSLRENGGSAFFSGLKSSSSKAADMISKGLFGKNSRSGSTTEREPVVDDEHYVLKVINLPLVEQTRRTRISKRLEDSRDKTEFWMPAFPWRAIDYLNYKGTDVEGLYRVPGSGPQIKKWQRKFDEEYDVDLFEQDDLYDINIIGSMLKAWLRELPDELFPKAAQERVARECAGAEKVPQLLIDELSNLSPFNYYLLFAITCHLSLLLAHSDKNKMDFRNLCICFQPCMKIDAFSFKFLVCDWRECWKGCKNEAKFIEEEYMLFDQPPPQGIAAPRAHEEEEGVPEDRNVSSSGSSKQSNQSGGEAGKARLKKKTHAPENASVASASTISTNLTIDSRQETTTPRRSNDLRPLSPIKPLSPLGF